MAREVSISFASMEEIKAFVMRLAQQANDGEEPEAIVEGRPPLRLRFINEDDENFDPPSVYYSEE